MNVNSCDKLDRNRYVWQREARAAATGSTLQSPLALKGIGDETSQSPKTGNSPSLPFFTLLAAALSVFPSITLKILQYLPYENYSKLYTKGMYGYLLLSHPVY